MCECVSFFAPPCPPDVSNQISLRKPAGRRGGVSFCERSENLGVWGVVGAKRDQNLEPGGEEVVQGSDFPPHVPCRVLATVGHRFPPGPCLAGGL